MEQIGHLNNKDIFYINIRENQNWSETLPSANWLAFTIADELDRELLIDSIPICVSKNVSYTCSVGKLAELTEDLFDEEIVWRAHMEEEKTGRAHDYETSPITTMYQNFSQGFWFATTLTYDQNFPISKIVCLDFTTNGVKNYLEELIKRVSNNCLPSDDEYEEPLYDN